MIPRSMVRVCHQRPHSCSIVCRNAWRSNRLQLNTAKTEAIWRSSTRHQHQIPQSPLVVSSDAVVQVRVVRDLGIYLDSDLMMRSTLHLLQRLFRAFCGVETASQHPAVCVRSSLAVTFRGIGDDEARRQRHIGRTACRSA